MSLHDSQNTSQQRIKSKFGGSINDMKNVTHQKAVNIDLNGSNPDSDKKSLCLRSIKINMKKSKINLELSTKLDNERYSHNTLNM